jgi:hypothetical protein
MIWYKICSFGENSNGPDWKSCQSHAHGWCLPECLLISLQAQLPILAAISRALKFNMFLLTIFGGILVAAVAQQ